MVLSTYKYEIEKFLPSDAAEKLFKYYWTCCASLVDFLRRNEEVGLYGQILIIS